MIAHLLASIVPASIAARLQQSFIVPKTIGARLMRSFVVLAILLSGAGVIAYNSLHSSAATATAALEVIQRDARLSSELSAAVAEEMQAAGLYLRDRDPTALETFRRLNFQTHRITRSMNRQATRESDHITLVATVDRTLSSVEVTYARAHRHLEMGDTAAARREEAGVSAGVRQLLGAIDRRWLLPTCGVRPRNARWRCCSCSAAY